MPTAWFSRYCVEDIILKSMDEFVTLIKVNLVGSENLACDVLKKFNIHIDTTLVAVE